MWGTKGAESQSPSRALLCRLAHTAAMMNSRDGSYTSVVSAGHLGGVRVFPAVFAVVRRLADDVGRDVVGFRRVISQLVRPFSENWQREREGRPLLHIGCFRKLRLVPVVEISRETQSSTCTCDVLILIYLLSTQYQFLCNV